MFRELVEKNRSYGAFYEDVPVKLETLMELVDLARISPSSMNLQPLKYILSNDKETNDFIYDHIRWASYIKKWQGPPKGERPAAYIIILIDRQIRVTGGRVDAGIALSSILLGATEKELGGCIISAIDRSAFIKKFQIPEHLEIMLVLGIGKPKGEISLVETDDEIIYYKGEDGTTKVPKRKLKDIIFDPEKYEKHKFHDHLY